MSQFINPTAKLFQHLDRLQVIKEGGKPAPVNVEIDLSNRCSHGCSWCLTKAAFLDILGRGKCSIADVRPGNCVLAYNENTGKAQWAEVYAVSNRKVSETIYHIVVGGKAIEATGNHEVFTRRGWVDARHLTLSDEVAHVSEIMRMRLRSSGEIEGVALLSRSRTDSGNAPRQQQAHESQQSDAQVRRGGTCCCEQANDQSEDGRDAQAHVSRGNAQAERGGGGGARAILRADEGQQPHEECRCSCKGKGNESGQGRERTDKSTSAPEMERPKVPCLACGSHEEEQSHAPHRSDGKELERATLAPRCDEDGDVVCGTDKPASISDLVFGTERVLGEWAQSRLQGSRPQVSYRDNGRLHLPQASADARELLFADDSALRSEWSRLLSSDDARTSAQVDEGITARFSDDSLGLLGDWQECDLEFQRITSIVPIEMAVEVFNLETSTATYFANDLLVHNCHFAHTHTRGPLAGKVARPDGAISGGDLMSKELASSILLQLKRAGTKSVTWTGGGEPTLHPDFDWIVRQAAFGGLEQGMYTHGGHITAERADIIKGLFTWVFISLDECTPEAFKASKGVGRFDAVLTGIRNLVAAEGKATIGVGFLLHPGNYREVYHMVQLGKSLGVDYVQFRPTIQYEQDAPGELAEDTAWLTEAIALLKYYEGDSFVVADIERFKMYRDWTGHGYPTCNWSALQTVISPNGMVWRCTNKREHPDALLGDLSKESFADVWARSGGACTVNASCRVLCRGHIANVALDKIMTPMPHANFI